MLISNRIFVFVSEVGFKCFGDAPLALFSCPNPLTCSLPLSLPLFLFLCLFCALVLCACPLDHQQTKQKPKKQKAIVALKNPL